MKVSVGQKYILNRNNFYWCTNLQQRVMFENPVIVEVTNTFMNKLFFGKLITVNALWGITYSNNEIEFSELDVKDYFKEKDFIVPLIDNEEYFIKLELIQKRLKKL